MATDLPNPLPDSWISVLRALAEYSYMVRPQLSDLLFPSHGSSRYCRKVLSDMIHHRLVAKTQRKITFDENRSGCPVYFLQERGIEALAEATEDARFLKANRKPPRADRLEHWVQTSQVHLVLDQALRNQAARDYVQAPVWWNEWTKYRADGHNEYFLHVQFQTQPTKLSCSPDGAFLLVVSGMQMPWYVETDLGSSSPPQVVHRKAKGYQQLAESGLFRERHFPQLAPREDDFRILVVTTTRWRRDRMAAIASKAPGAHRWRFVAFQDLVAEWILHERVILDTQDNWKRLVKPLPEYVEVAPDVRLASKKRQSIPELVSE